MNVFDTLLQRGLVEQATDMEKIKELLGGPPVTFYTGYDPTADSLHIGHFLQLVTMRRLQKAGHRPIMLLGVGTTMVGDPTGKTDMRQMLTLEQIAHNAERFKSQMSKFIDFSDGKALMLSNADWLLKLNYVDFLRDIGVHYSVNRMLAMEAFKARLERGLSFIEFNYALMQGYDFYHLYRHHDCKLQLGGNDQWSNIIGGVELIRKKCGGEAYGLTFTLLTTADGQKMGKTVKGAVWLDPEKTTPYEFYQYWRNVDDADVCRCLKLLTEVPLEAISEYERQGGAQLNDAKQLLAYELTAAVHGTDEAIRARDTASALFSGGDAADMPATALSESDLKDDAIEILDLLVKCKLAASRGEGRRLIEQGGLTLDDAKISDPFAVVSVETLKSGVVIKKGKKIFHRAIFES